MRRLTLSAALAALALLTIITATPAGAVDIGCMPATNRATVYSTAGSGEALGWAPDCVRVTTTFATPGAVDFTNLDPLFHQPVSSGCFDQFTVNVGQTKALEGLRLINGKPYIGYTPCDLAATQARVGTFIPRTEGERLPVVELNADGAGTATIHFICAFHGPVMHGKIVLSNA